MKYRFSVLCHLRMSSFCIYTHRTSTFFKLTFVSTCQIHAFSAFMGITSSIHLSYPRLLCAARRTLKKHSPIGAVLSDCRQNAFGQHSRSVFLVFGSKSVYLINNKLFWAPLFPFLAIIFASFFRFMQANVSPTFISIRAFPIICV